MTQPNVTTLDDPKTTEAAKPAAATKAKRVDAVNGASTDFSGKRSVITIAPGPEEGGRDAVFVGVAGVGFLVPRGQSCDVPVEVANVLRDAKTTTWEWNEGLKKHVAIEGPRFSFIAQDAPAAA